MITIISAFLSLVVVICRGSLTDLSSWDGEDHLKKIQFEGDSEMLQLERPKRDHLFRRHHVFIRTVTGAVPERECIGHLISSFHVLTLASCVILSEGNTSLPLPSRKPEFLKIRLGSKYRSREGIIVYSDNVCVHPDYMDDYKERQQIKDKDKKNRIEEIAPNLAIVTLSRRFDESQNIDHVTLHARHCLKYSIPCYLFTTFTTDDASDEMREITANVTVERFESCLGNMYLKYLVEPDYTCLLNEDDSHPLKKAFPGSGVICNGKLFGMLTALHYSDKFRVAVRTDDIKDLLRYCSTSSSSILSQSFAFIIIIVFSRYFC